MLRAYKTVRNGKELLEFLQGCSEDELLLPLARTDNSHDYGPFYDIIDTVEINDISTGGISGPCITAIVF